MSAGLRKEELRWWQMSKAAHISCSQSIRQNLLPPITCHVSVVGCRHTWHFSLCSQPGLNSISHSKASWWKIYLFNVCRHGIIFGFEILAHDVNQMWNLKNETFLLLNKKWFMPNMCSSNSQAPFAQKLGFEAKFLSHYNSGRYLSWCHNHQLSNSQLHEVCLRLGFCISWAFCCVC